MRRDMNLVLRILAEIEANPCIDRPVVVSVGRYEPDDVRYHVQILAEAGFVDVEECQGSSRTLLRPRCLTWKGHNLLEDLRAERSSKPLPQNALC